MASRYEEEEYIEQDEEEREAAGRRTTLIALAAMAVLVVVGLFIVQRLHRASVIEDCLLAHGSNCNDLVNPPTPAGGGSSTKR